MAKKQRLGVRAYAFSLKKFHTRGDEQTISLNLPIHVDFPDDTSKDYDTALDIFEEFIEYSGIARDKEERQQIFRTSAHNIKKGDTDRFSYLFFKVHAGYYGYTSKVINRETMAVVHTRTTDEADVKQFYVMVAVPKDCDGLPSNRGLLFFQEIGIYGVKTVTTDAMQAFLSQHLKITLKTQNLAPDFYLNKLFDNGEIKKIRLARNIFEADKSDRLYGASIGREERSITPLEITKALKKELRHIAEDQYSFFTFEDINYDEVKMEVTISGRKRVIDLHGLDTLSIEEALPDDLLLPDGTVSLTGFIEHMLPIAEEYLDHLPVAL